jgi:hypothetical protein
VLSFYQERIANEGYLRTATERRSLFELARLVGYRPRPGVAASVFLAYTIDANTAQAVLVRQGAQVQSVPGQDELPQTFETSEPLQARAAWNRLGVRRTQPQQWLDITSSGLLHLAGTATRLKPGDALLLDRARAGAPPAPYRVLSVDADPSAQRTAVRVVPWDKPVPGTPGRAAQPLSIAERIRRLVEPPSQPRPSALQLPLSLASSFDPIADAGLKVLAATAPRLQATLAPALAGDEAATPPQPLRVWALRLQAGLFGRGFPRRTRTESVRDDNELARLATRTVDDGEWPIVTGVRASEDSTLQVQAREAPDTLYLDAGHEGIEPGSWVFVDASAVAEGDKAMVVPVRPLLVAQVRNVMPKLARADYGGSGDTTALQLAGPGGKPVAWIDFHVKDRQDFDDPVVREQDFQVVRRVAVYARSEELALAQRPIEEPLCHHAEEGESRIAPIELDGLYAGLEPGRLVIVSGERADMGATRGVFTAEAAMISSVVHDVRAAGHTLGPLTYVRDGSAGLLPRGPAGKAAVALPGDRVHTFVWLDKPLAYCYRRESVAILGNVVKATHGEKREETLGHGDGAEPLQRFSLKQSPLTHLPAPTASGAQSTLQVHVNDVRWQETPSLVGHADTDKVYMVHIDDAGIATVQFGNGREGARLPTGVANIKAEYRRGIGRAGNVRPGQLQLLVSRPVGVREVTNPLRASGGADPESSEQLRRNTPLAVKALDRLVSTPDYADFARTFAGIGKADAVALSDGRRSTVHLTVAGVDDIPIDPDSELMLNLRRALRELGDPFQPLQVASRELRLLVIAAGLRLEPDRLWEPVVTRVRAALLEAFGFEARELAQGVASSEVLCVMQSVPGVAGVDLDVFGAIDTVHDDAGGARPASPREIADAVREVFQAGLVPAVQSLRARPAADSRGLLPAQLVLLSAEVPETLVLNRLT